MVGRLPLPEHRGSVHWARVHPGLARWGAHRVHVRPWPGRPGRGRSGRRGAAGRRAACPLAHRASEYRRAECPCRADRSARRPPRSGRCCPRLPGRSVRSARSRAYRRGHPDLVRNPAVAYRAAERRVVPSAAGRAVDPAGPGAPADPGRFAGHRDRPDRAAAQAADHRSHRAACLRPGAAACRRAASKAAPAFGWRAADRRCPPRCVVCHDPDRVRANCPVRSVFGVAGACRGPRRTVGPVWAPREHRAPPVAGHVAEVPPGRPAADRAVAAVRHLRAGEHRSPHRGRATSGPPPAASKVGLQLACRCVRRSRVGLPHRRASLARSSVVVCAVALSRPRTRWRRNHSAALRRCGRPSSMPRVPRTYDCTRWFQLQVRQTSTT
ncbi:hypothetical protein TL08_26810 [Actinoalloteichus hymeniacidonis]|uniref:Uncharacterized protein n=1 Tax=Actinoalloteichus hymeniacidonis TaxID=340345 RepID=A0AAC9HVM1_9PSEU|nr:hypothetical protein TL08_26810 [Actinoalloteichus hymeniacidonis]